MNGAALNNPAVAHVHLVFEPYFPWWLLAVLGGLFLGLMARRLMARKAGSLWRIAALAGLLLALANPWMVEETRQALNDIAVVAVDRSASETVSGRMPLIEQTRQKLLARLQAIPNLDLREVSVDGRSETRLRPALSEALRDVGSDRLAGTFVITDGQVMDDSLPEDILGAPVHGLIAGKRGEYDRRIEMQEAPQYAIVGRPLELVAKIVEDGAKGAGSASVPVTLLLDGKKVISRDMPVNVDIRVSVPIDRPGPTTVELAVAEGAHEISTVNNHAALIVNGVRDRLRVLLITGDPYQGARTWRDILKSDGAVDLVHFTILRPPLKQDFTPVDELSLIAFPTYELFQQKLQDFDLVIFDHYFWRGELPLEYLSNVVRYVELGGAVVSVAGPSYAGVNSLFSTPLGEILPAAPTGNIIEEGFRPALTDIGRRHPITRGLLRPDGTTPDWGSWYRQIDARVRHGTVLMSGPGNRPLLVVDHVGKGRVAELLSDESWLWARGHQGGGPQGEMLRRLAHWVMKEPELEEETLTAKTTATGFDIERRSIGQIGDSLDVQRPDGSSITLPYASRKDGVGHASLAVTQPGLYRFTDGKIETVAAFGALQAPELGRLVATAQPLEKLARGNGGFAFLGDDAMPDIRLVASDAPVAGPGWMGILRRSASLSTGLKQTPLIPGWIYLLVIGGGMMLAWYREGRPG